MLSEIEKKWQDKWRDAKVFTAYIRRDMPKHYTLEMFPYPSGKLHVGHLRNYSIGDVNARFKRAQGYNVLHPGGWDAFGMPAENAAIENNEHPKDWTLKNIEIMREQQKILGVSYDWDREVTTCLPDYYKHEQEMFISFLQHGIAYQKEALVNWDPVDCTVLANEQVINGKGWRSNAPIEQKKIKQWFLKITDFAEELLDDLQLLECWPDNVKIMQENWIGKSVGAIIHFRVVFDVIDKDDKDTTVDDVIIDVYSTRPDTLFGASFIAVAPDHPIIAMVCDQSIMSAVQDFITHHISKFATTKTVDNAQKIGVNLGIKVQHPFLQSILLPVYVTNFVVMEYGTGAVFGCPAHDQRDYDFAIKYNLPIIEVVKPRCNDNNISNINNGIAFVDDGICYNSDFLNGIQTQDAKHIVIKKLKELGCGYSCTKYKLRDWGVSRQRYWGCPIPVIYCEHCGMLPVRKEDLPVTLPDDIKLGGGGNPLEKIATWTNIICHVCGGKAKRETDTFDTFFESSWYFLRFCSPHSKLCFDKEEVAYWMPVDNYIGGIDHAILHLLYSRFFFKALKKCGYFGDEFDEIGLKSHEPFASLLTQGMVCRAAYKNENGTWIPPEDVVLRNGITYVKNTEEKAVCHGIDKMSKSKKNGIEYELIVAKYGADAARLFILSDSPPERNIEWSDDGIEAAHKYIKKIYKTAQIFAEMHTQGVKYENSNLQKGDFDLQKMTHRTIKFVTNNIEHSHFNKAIAHMREQHNAILDKVDDVARDKKNNISKQPLISFLVLLRLFNPFIPHITEEAWEMLNNNAEMLAFSKWPEYDDALVCDDVVSIAIQINGKLRGVAEVECNASKDEVIAIAMKHNRVSPLLNGRDVRNVIYVQRKIVNFIV